MTDERRAGEQKYRDLQELRHAENVARFRLLDERLRLIDQHITNDKQEKAAMRQSIQDNATLAQSIKTDTAALVAIARVPSAIRKFLIWFLPLLASAATVIGAYIAIKK